MLAHINLYVYDECINIKHFHSGIYFEPFQGYNGPNENSKVADDNAFQKYFLEQFFSGTTRNAAS